jgi:hypothetical protein
MTVTTLLNRIRYRSLRCLARHDAGQCTAAATQRLRHKRKLGLFRKNVGEGFEEGLLRSPSLTKRSHFYMAGKTDRIADHHNYVQSLALFERL